MPANRLRRGLRFVCRIEGRQNPLLTPQRGAVDVCKIAQKFAGGGHVNAAGAYISGPLNSAKQAVFDLVKSDLNA